MLAKYQQTGGQSSPKWRPKSTKPERKERLTRSDWPKTMVKSKAKLNLNPHPSLTLSLYAKWDKVNRFMSFILKVGDVDI